MSLSELESMAVALNRFTWALSIEAIETLLKLNLTMTQARALYIVGRLERPSGRRLARELGVSPASVVAICDRLEAQGYIERVRDAADGRVRRFQLTPAGHEALQHQPAVRARILPVLAGLSSSDRERLVQILDALAAAIDAGEKPKGAG